MPQITIDLPDTIMPVLARKAEGGRQTPESFLSSYVVLCLENDEQPPIDSAREALEDILEERDKGPFVPLPKVWRTTDGLGCPFRLLVCAWMIWRIRKDSERHHSTAATGVFCIALTLAVFAACTWMTTRMMSAAVDPREVPLKLSVESR